MNTITKISDITYNDLASFLRLVELSLDDENTLVTLLGVAKNFVSKYTGRSLEELDEYQDMVIVIFILVQDMWDNRTMYINEKNLNNTIITILNLHSVNLLWLRTLFPQLMRVNTTKKLRFTRQRL